MILTKSEFKDEFGFKHLSSVSNLLKEKSIVATKDGLIDLNNKKNKQWISRRKKELEALQNKSEEQAHHNGECSRLAKSAQLVQREGQEARREINPQQLQFDILKEKLNEKLKKNQLLDTKIAEANKAVISVDILNRVITMTFDSLFKELVDLPSISIDEIINIVQMEKHPSEKINAFLTEKILSSLKTALNIAENNAKKYYERNCAN